MAALWTMMRHVAEAPANNNQLPALILHCDNNAAIAAVKFGSMRFMKGPQATTLVSLFIFFF
jgi:hypothetical protein